MKAMWHVVVRDSTGAEVTDAKIALVKEADVAGKDFPFDTVATTHSHKGKGSYEPDAEIAPAAGKWFLAVNRNGSSAAVQPFTVKAAGSGFSLSSSGFGIATVEMKSATAGSGAAAVLNTSFVVKLFPSAELVFYTGSDPHNAGVDFRIFAVDHAKALLHRGLVDSGTRVTIFCCDARARQHLAFTPAANLVLVNASSFGDATGIAPGRKHDAVVGKDVTPVDFYDYLSGVGAEDPHRVREVGIFSHSWPGGPILFDTYDKSPTGDRDPKDFDLRAKDFNATNMVLWPDLKDAMAPGGSWHIWGCSATTMYKDWMRESLKVAKEDQLFSVVSDVVEGGVTSQHIEARMTRKHLRVLMDRQFRQGSYMSAAAATLGLPVFGAPPGVGADYSRVGGLQVMGIAGNTAPYSYFPRDFAPDFKPTTDPFDHGYVDYHAMQARAPAPAAAFDPGIYVLTVDFDEKTTSLGFHVKQAPTHAGTSVKLTVTAKTGFPAAGRSGHLYVIEDTDKTKSEAYYMQSDGQVFRVTRDAKQAFNVVSAAPL